MPLCTHPCYTLGRVPLEVQAILILDGGLWNGVGTAGVVIQIGDQLIESNTVIPASPFLMSLYRAELGGWSMAVS